MGTSEQITTQESTVADWTRALGEPIGAPGGGAGAGVMLSLAASLTSMVAGYTEPDAGEEDQLNSVLIRAQNLRQTALQLADDDAAASHAFGAAFKLERGRARDEAIRKASVEAAESSAVLGEHAIGAIDDLTWLTENGNSALVADVVVAFGALRAAVAGARTNVSFDLGTLRAGGLNLEEVREQHPELWTTVHRFDDAMARIDAATNSIDGRAAPTDNR
ncbi:cyclodeaminase/cyclohydrolase family protein [Nesterenkonia natronophila]|uniref:Formiminotransferase-cyclodeaminase n=1 Tax=Nesterenkonia natronophila TaxID=2174932 RepID=A0A3A4FCN6_9MICC|nr:cyclodeaminase/cyclohydrolase family protein [Nesterenkonia natronophila]RJN32524.1 formiminotransferase-cyclodeaminase [Nesterenkonia natronophila]